jgi:tetratricopeptide (TPR) repeat protein
MIIIAFVISGLLVSGYVFFRNSGSSNAPIYDSREPIPIPADILQSQGRENSIRELLAQDPDNPLLLARLGDLFFERGDFGQAIVKYEKVIKISPEDVDTINDLGLSYHFVSRPEDALNSLRKGTEIDPSFQRVWLSLGFVHASNRNYTDARVALIKAIELDPTSGVGMEAQRILDRTAFPQ